MRSFAHIFDNAVATMRCQMIACVLACLSLSSVALAADDDFTIQGGNISNQNGVYLLDAQLNFSLPKNAEAMVREGVAMNVTVEVRFDHIRRWWTNQNIAALEQRYTLIFHSVSERFLVRNVNSGAQTSFATFAEAVAALKNIRGLPLLDTDLLRVGTRNEVSMRASVDIRSIPRALGIILFWVDDFSLKSDWYTWPMKLQDRDTQ
jgi:hypothetical protein